MKLTVSNDSESVPGTAGLTVERTEEGIQIKRNYYHVTVNPLELDALIFFLEEMKHVEGPKIEPISSAYNDDEIPF